MTRVFSLNTLSAAAIAVSICACNLAAQEKPNKTTKGNAKAFVIHEVKLNAGEIVRAPEECLQTFREFFNYVQKPTPDIVSDEKAQQKWLSLDLRKALADKVKRAKEESAKNPTDKPDYPGNGSFVGAWDSPSTYSVIGSRQYEENIVVDILYAWGAGTNYAGDKRLMSFFFVKENGVWKLSDVYTFRGEFVGAESLIQYLRGN